MEQCGYYSTTYLKLQTSISVKTSDCNIRISLRKKGNR